MHMGGTLQADNPHHTGGIDEAPSVIATPAQILAWAEAAKPRAVFHYATRFCRLPTRMPGAQTMRSLAAQGLVDLCQRPIAGCPERNYEAQRTSLPWPKPKAPRDRLMIETPAIAADVEAVAVDLVLPILLRAAQYRRPCPTDRQIAERAQITVGEVEPAMKALRDLHIIRVHSAPAPTLRQVTIVQTGFQTGFAQ